MSGQHRTEMEMNYDILKVCEQRKASFAVIRGQTRISNMRLHELLDMLAWQDYLDKRWTNKNHTYYVYALLPKGKQYLQMFESLKALLGWDGKNGEKKKAHIR